MTVNLFIKKGVFHTEEVIKEAYKAFFDSDTPKVLRTENNKPYFENSPIFFSLSHSKEYTAVSFCEENIGIDLQDRRSCNQKSIAKKFFHPCEQKALENGFDFYKIWAMKESFIKYKGTGIDKNFKDFSVFDLNYFTFVDIPDHILCIYSPVQINVRTGGFL